MISTRPRPGRFTVLNAGPSTARGLVVACPMQGLGSAPNTGAFVAPWNLVDRTRPSFVDSAGHPDYITGATGTALATALSGSAQMWFDHASLSNRFFSAEVWIRFSAFQTSSPYISGVLNLGGTSGSPGTVGVLRMNIGSVLGENNRIYSDWGYPTRALSAGVLYQVGVSTDGTTSRVVLDGTVLLEGSSVPASSSFTRTFLFRDDQTGGRNPAAAIEAFHLWSRPLTVAEWAGRAADPWSLYRIRPASATRLAAISLAARPDNRSSPRGVHRGLTRGVA